MLSKSVILRSGASDYYYPPLSSDTWETVLPESLGWNEAAIADTIKYLGENKSIGFIILYKGRIVAEKMFHKYTIHDRRSIASTSKCMTSFLVGIAQKQGYLKIEDQVNKYLGPGWSKVPPQKEDLITIKHLLTMTSGLTEDYLDEEKNLLYEADAGTKWLYNTPAYWKLYEVVRAATKRTVSDYTKEVLWSAIGMQDSIYVDARISGKEAIQLARGTQGAVNVNAYNDSGEVIGDGLPTTTSCSTRDMARFGLMVLGNGTWAGKDLIRDKKYMSDAVNTSQDLNHSYGYLWWLNGKDSYILPVAQGVFPANPVGKQYGALIPDAPQDTIAALGFGDKKIYVVPSLDLVVCRHGDAAGVPRLALSSFDNQIWTRLMKAFPAFL